MEEYLRVVLDYLPEEMTEKPETPSASNLFNVRNENEQELLNETQATAFHHAVAQLLFTVIRCRKDAQTAIAFLTTRVFQVSVNNRRTTWVIDVRSPCIKDAGHA